MADILATVVYSLLLIGFYITNLYLYRHHHKLSLRKIELKYGTFKVFGGVFMGGGGIIILDYIQQTYFLDLDEVTAEQPYFGILMFLIGLILYAISTTQLRDNIFKPIREFENLSTILGRKTTFVNFPELGANEIAVVAKHLNNKLKGLADQMSLIKIHTEQLKAEILGFDNALKDIVGYNAIFDESLSTLENITGQFEYVERHVKNVDEAAANLVSRYNETINSSFVNLNEAVEVIKLIGINMAIEAHKSDNDALQSISTQIKEFSDFLEENVKTSYTNFSASSHEISKKVDSLKGISKDIETDKEYIKRVNLEISSKISKFSRSLDNVLEAQRSIARYVREIIKDIPLDY